MRGWLMDRRYDDCERVVSLLGVLTDFEIDI